ncbi:hypothetical protein MPTK1_5g00620 [Marchantia polymorpha subsp. ruderalis]|uniref:WPP domain-containing protein n=2 Tax=Marchantia polymorpha TaxID=3197 RepID=A0AAF6BDI3_MARPO|nr:hypothetical protein MARPO_0078s0061 [Marchantia polymorpha]BBN10067.1 hypothetical protein Mp_5g00620 [Marchantia polymorpha subsp. ruderalis]|eukprot:PTQ34660.1 hypothetical protein MARPO_0078s0061 [Marchantia polymorpha]
MAYEQARMMANPPPKVVIPVMLGVLTAGRQTINEARVLEARILEKLDSVSELDLDFRLIEDNEMATLGRAFQQRPFPGLEILSLSQNRVEELAMPQIARAIETGNLSNLRKLNLYKCRIDGAGAIMLAEALQSGNLSRLQNLELSYNNIGDMGLVAISNALASGYVPAIKTLSLGGDVETQGEGFHVQGSQALARAFQSGNSPLLEDLQIWGIVEEEGVIAVIKGLESRMVGCFKSLYFSNCKIRLDGAKALARALQSPSFSYLSLLGIFESPMLGDEGVAALAEAFKSSNLNSLEHLYLNYVRMKDKGWSELTALLEAGHLPNLSGIYAIEDFHHISRSSAEALAKAYHNNTSLVAKVIVCKWPNEGVEKEVENLRSINQNLRTSTSAE